MDSAAMFLALLSTGLTVAGLASIKSIGARAWWFLVPAFVILAGIIDVGRVI